MSSFNYSVVVRQPFSNYAFGEVKREPSSPSPPTLVIIETDKIDTGIETLFRSTIERHLPFHAGMHLIRINENRVWFLEQSQAFKETAKRWVEYLKEHYEGWNLVLCLSNDQQPPQNISPPDEIPFEMGEEVSRISFSVDKKSRIPARISRQMIQNTNLRLSPSCDYVQKKLMKEAVHIQETENLDRLRHQLGTSLRVFLSFYRKIDKSNTRNIDSILSQMKTILTQAEVVFPGIISFLNRGYDACYGVKGRNADFFSTVERTFLPFANTVTQHHQIDWLKRVLLPDIYASWYSSGEHTVACRFTTRGTREQNEDRSFIFKRNLTLAQNNISFVAAGVCDGHGGDAVSTHVSERFTDLFVEVFAQIADVRQIQTVDDQHLDWLVWDSLITTFTKLQGECRKNEMVGGTTVSIALIFENGVVYTANAGDSRSCLLLGEKPPVALSDEANFDRHRYKRRALEMGGQIRCTELQGRVLEIRSRVVNSNGYLTANTGGGVGDYDEIPFFPTIHRRKFSEEEWLDGEIIIASDGVFGAATVDDLAERRKLYPSDSPLLFSKAIAGVTAVSTCDNVTIVSIYPGAINFEEPLNTVLHGGVNAGPFGQG